MKLTVLFLSVFLFVFSAYAQDLTQGLRVNDTQPRPLQPIGKPGYLKTIKDPSFGTTIRRISDAGNGNIIKPMYSTVQAWNADESLMILYDQSKGVHQLLDGMTYQFIRNLDDIRPDDIEQLFWDFDNPNVLYYLELKTDDFIRYNPRTKAKEVLVNLDDATPNCTGSISLGNDVQMMSWDSDVVGFRCNNDKAYSYRISTGKVTEFAISDVAYYAPMPGPSGNLFYHNTDVYGANGQKVRSLNQAKVEHSCLGKLPNDHDANFSIAFAEGPSGGCIGDIIAHDLVTGECFPVISQSQGYDYPQSGTHISALAHKNTQGGWVAASMVGYDEDGQALLDQELVIARAEKGNVKVCRIGHHRSDEQQFDYWGEPHAVISPTGTRVLFGSDRSGSEDGRSVDSYVVELPSFKGGSPTNPPDNGPVGSIGEAGRVTTGQAGKNAWQTVRLKRTYRNPRVVMQSMTTNGGDPSTVRVRNVRGTSFQFQIDEWDYLDGGHTRETLSYVVLEDGSHTLNDGTRITAGSQAVNTSWKKVNLPTRSSAAPVVVSQVTSTNEGSAVITRQRNVTASSFEVLLQEEEKSDRRHKNEAVHWLAIEPGAGKSGAQRFEGMVMGSPVGTWFRTATFRQNFTQTPTLLYAFQNFVGPDPIALRHRNLSRNAVSIRGEEERSQDDGGGHSPQRVGVVLFEPGLISGRTQSSSARYATEETKPAVTDQEATYAIYPNPSTGSLTVTSDLTDTPGRLTVTDAYGKLVYDRQVSFGQTSSQDIDLSTLTNGLYYVTMDQAGRPSTNKLIIRR